MTCRVVLQSHPGSRTGAGAPVVDAQRCEPAAVQPVQPSSNGTCTPQRVRPSLMHLPVSHTYRFRTVVAVSISLANPSCAFVQFQRSLCLMTDSPLC